MTTLVAEMVDTPSPAVLEQWIPVDSIKVWARNPRKNDEAVARVAESIKRFGWGRSLVARRANRELIVGHTARRATLLLIEQFAKTQPAERRRWHDEALRTAETGLVPVRLKEIPEHEAHLLALADNRLGELAEWDTPELHAQLAEYTSDEALLAGWDDADLVALASDDPPPVKPAKKVKTEDNHCPYCGRYMSDKLMAAHAKREGQSSR